MPTIAILDEGITIAIYYNDHNPPHFHAMQADDEILVVIASLAVFAGSAPAVMTRRVLDWQQRIKPNWRCAGRALRVARRREGSGNEAARDQASEALFRHPHPG